MDYATWEEEVENLSWIRLGAQLDEFEDVDFDDLYLQGRSPEEVVQYLYEEDMYAGDEDDGEADPEDY